jgi:hypothetical protein
MHCMHACGTFLKDTCESYIVIEMRYAFGAAVRYASSTAVRRLGTADARLARSDHVNTQYAIHNTPVCGMVCTNSVYVFGRADDKKGSMVVVSRGNVSRKRKER